MAGLDLPQSEKRFNQDDYCYLMRTIYGHQLDKAIHRTACQPAPYDAPIPFFPPLGHVPCFGIANTIVRLRPLPSSINLHRAAPDKELEDDLGDERRNMSAKRLLMGFAEKPTESMVGASHGRPETMVAYRYVTETAIALYKRIHDATRPTDAHAVAEAESRPARRIRGWLFAHRRSELVRIRRYVLTFKRLNREHA
ncbi:transposase DNA-binding-containing protein [Paraburkholderia sp. EG286B]|uniref:transposase DNA-binding-containing protein n=1 Tax=Paraburkholderia sp. EG286B TaxID=3237011 RepID=UPI0034D2FEDD